MLSKFKAPQIQRYIDWLGRVGYQQSDCSYSYDAKTNALLGELFTLLEEIEPNENRGWSFWLKADRGTIEDFGNCEEWLEDGAVDSYEEFEQCWKAEYPNAVEWFDVYAIFDAEIDYRAVFVRHKFVIELDSRKPKSEEHDISEFAQWLVDGVKDMLSELKAGTYNSRIKQELPVQHRVGTVLRKYEWEVIPELRKQLIGNLTDANLNEFLKYAKSSLSDDERLPQITANDFYSFCALGYRACGYEGTDAPAAALYKRYADGRDDGLSEIEPDSPTAFDAWFHDRQRFGGHPWEVCRGGNSTHIDLYVREDVHGWYLQVAGSAWTRCAEAALFFLALHRAGIPVCIYQAELLKARFLGEEKIGIVPSGVFPAYCHSYFPGEDVIDFMHLPDEKDVLEQLLPHCIWQPLDAIKLKKGNIDNGQSE